MNLLSILPSPPWRLIALFAATALVAGGAGLSAGSAWEVHQHRLMSIRGAQPFTHVELEKGVAHCYEAGTETDCRAWLSRHFTESCGWEP